MVKLKNYFALLVFGVGLFVPGLSGAGVIIADSVTVTDVTPVQFSVVWGTIEPAIGSVNVFLDEGGTAPATEAVVKFESSDHPPAADIGVMKVRVTNLKPSTQYYFQIKTTSKNSGSVTLDPETPPFMAVRTEQGSIIVRNDVLAQQISMASGKSTQGTLVIAEIDQASYPLSGWAGNGVPDGWAAIDANNFYDKDTHVNLDLNGGEPITLTFFCGSLGSVVTNDKVPPESGGIKSVSVAATLPSSGSGGGAVSASSSGGGGGGGCFIATAAFGSTLERHVQILSQFRDKRLLTNRFGRWFVRTYYKISPPVADYLRRNPTARVAVRYALIPVTGAAHMALHVNPLILLSIFACFLVGILSFIRNFSKSEQRANDN